MEHNLSSVPKKPYEKPAVKRVKLEPEDTLLANCKYASTGKSGRTCSIPQSVGPCKNSDVGS